MEQRDTTGGNTMQTRNEQISDLFRAEQATVQRRVSRKVTAPAATIEDACSYAWTQLVAHTEVRLMPTWDVLAWLVTVATREAISQTRRASRTNVELIEDQSLAVAPENVEQTVIGRDRLRALKALTDRKLPALTERQRQMLFLHASGYTYREIHEITGATLRTVDRQLRRAYDRVREIEQENS